jgi:hypothetical protein
MDCTKNIKFFLIIFLLFGNIQHAYPQKDSLQWFPKNGLFPFLEYDLLEVKPYVGVFILNTDSAKNNGAYIPVNIGFRKSFIQWKMLNMKFDFALGLASYTQFEIVQVEENTLKGGLMNTDFKVSGFLSAVKGNHKFRLQLFHISSHLGDDYILRNEDYELNDKSVNYEQIDLSYLYSFSNAGIYAGIGSVISPNTFRKRFMAEIGYQASYPMTPKVDFTFGSDIKLYDENEFIPDIHAGIGITLKQREQHQINFLIDGYYGRMPYSTLDFGQVYWFGVSASLYL